MITDIQFIRPEHEAFVGAIFYGRIDKVDDKLQASFIDLGLDAPGYLDHRDYHVDDKKKGLTEGQYVVVQVTKAPYLSKGARLTRRINLSSQTLVYLPHETGINVSRKIEDDQRRRIQSLLKDELDGSGVVVRTKAQHVEDDKLIMQLNALKKQYEKMIHKSKTMKKPGRLTSKSAAHLDFIQHHALDNVSQIIVDDVVLMREIESIAGKHIKVHVQRLALQQLKDKITNYIESMTLPVVDAGQGVELIVERTEAMHVIDVNSNSYSSNQSQKRSFVSINKQAAKKAAEIIRSRNLSGMILIDFIRMRDKKDQQIIFDTLKAAMKKDTVPVTLYGFSRLGLFELTRKRESRSPQETLVDQQVKNWPLKIDTQCFELERTLFTMDDEAAIISLPPAIYEAFKALVNIKMLNEQLRSDVYIVIDPLISHVEIIRKGSESLINEYISANPSVSIDKL